MKKRRLPAEWEEQDGVLLAWPHESTDWHPCLDEVEPVFTEVVRRVADFEHVLLVAPDAASLRDRLHAAGVPGHRVTIHSIPSNDTWARDFGPITVLENGTPILLDFGFNGWGLKFAAYLDNQVTRRLHEAGVFGGRAAARRASSSKGEASRATAAAPCSPPPNACSSANRNPHLDRAEMETALRRCSAPSGSSGWSTATWPATTPTPISTPWPGSAPGTPSLYVSLPRIPSDEHHAALARMAEELRRFRTRDGHPFRLLALPWPRPCYDDEGQRLPATYANFLVINGAVLVPTYRDEEKDAGRSER